MFFVTEMDSDAYLGSVLINAKSKSHYFFNARKELNQEFGENIVKFVKLSELYDLLGNTDSQETILLSKYTMAYKKAILGKYPSANVQIYDFDEKEPIQPSPYFWGS